MNVVIGLGNLGAAIARRLVMLSQDVVGVDIDPAQRAAWRATTGLDAELSVDSVDWQMADRAFVVVRLTSEAAQVLEDIRASSVARDLACLVVTTLEPSFARDLSRYDGGPMRVVELPVSGGALGAEAGDLTVMAAGPLAHADRTFLQSTLASHLVEFPERGHPTVVKLLNNVTAAYNARTLAEMLIAAQGEGIDVRRFYEVVMTASGGSWIARGFLDLVDELLDKDVGMLREHLGVLPVISLGPDDGLIERLGSARQLLRSSEQDPA